MYNRGIYSNDGGMWHLTFCNKQVDEVESNSMRTGKLYTRQLSMGTGYSQEPLHYLDGSTVFLFAGLGIAGKMKASVLTSRTEQ